MNETLFELIINKKYNEFYKLVNSQPNKVDFNIHDTHNNYILMYAIIYNELDLVIFLIEHGASLDIVDTDKRSILYNPIKFNHMSLFNKLIEYNKNNIGLDILNIQDNNGNTPLFYTITYNNIQMFEIIMNNITLFNDITNNNDLYLIHHAVLMNNKHILQSVIDYKFDINKRDKNNNTPLHLAISYNLKNAIITLLKNGANIDAQNNYSITPLHIAIYNKSSLIQDLITYNADINIQDANGNTFIHYLLDNELFNYIPLIIDKIKVDIPNKYHYTILHLILQIIIKNSDNYNKYKDIVLTFFDQMLLNMNLNFQDFEGNTPLHLLFNTTMWKDKLQYLKNKNVKFNIFIINKEQQTPIDILNENDKNYVIDYVINKYISDVNKSKYTDLKNICTGEGEGEGEGEGKKKNIMQFISILTKYYGVHKWDPVDKSDCKSILLSLFHYILNNKSLQFTCLPKSYVSNLLKACPSLIVPTKDIDVCRYTATSIDILSGLIYILGKYDNVIYPFYGNLTTNNALNTFYENNNIIIDPHILHNIEILWYNSILILPQNFDTIFEFTITYSIKNKIDFIIIPLGIIQNEEAHANYFIIQHSTKMIERFETHGSGNIIGFSYNSELLDSIIESKFQYFLSDYQYIKPNDNFPAYGFQKFDNYFQDIIIGDPGGFCALWALYYTEMRIANHNMNIKSIIKLIFNAIKSFKVPFKRILRNYSYNIVNIRDNILQKANIDINVWNNAKFTQTQFNQVVAEFTKILVGKLSKT